MEVIKNDPHREAFILGWQRNVRNPYILTSNSSDAFLLGKYARDLGLPYTTDLHKMRGYHWRLDGCTYLVDGRDIIPQFPIPPQPLKRQTECCKFCGEPVSLHDSGVTYKSGECAHEECDDAEESRRANAFELEEGGR